jgi:hypothetical protein
LFGASLNEAHEEAKEIVKKILSKENFAEDQATHVASIVEARLHPLLDNQISNCYAAEITEQTNQFIECCEEAERLKKRKEFFYQLKKQATQVHNNVKKLHF